MSKQNKIIIIAGPTASGKSAVAVELAKIMQTEIISADSMQIYKGLDVGTAKITRVEMQGIKHHLLDIISPEESYSVNEYITDAKKIIRELHSQGKIPIICGGTGLYINSLIYNFDLKEHKSAPELREKLEKLYKEKGGEYLLDILREFDPASAERLHRNNYRRIIRAIEIYKVSGITMTEQAEKTKIAPGEFDASLYVLSTDRERLYERIDRRVDKMLENGLYKEVKALLSANLPSNATCLQAIGYKEFKSVLSGDASEDEAIEKIKRESRRYAKRQLTWFRKNENAVWLDTAEFSDNPEKIAKHLYNMEKTKGNA